MNSFYTKAHRLCRNVFYDSRSGLFLFVNDFLSVVAIISITAIVLGYFSRFAGYQNAFLVIEYVSVAFFSLEYVCRIAGADKKWAYIFSFFGIVDLVAILPTLLYIGDLTPLKLTRVFHNTVEISRGLRSLGRVLRLMRVFKFIRLKADRHRNSRAES